MSLTRTCPKCGAALPDDGWEGLCPKCLVRVSLQSAGGETAGSNSPDAVSERATHVGGGKERDAGEVQESPVPGDLPTEPLGTTIGRYKLLQQIGEGGFGIVF